MAQKQDLNKSHSYLNSESDLLEFFGDPNSKITTAGNLIRHPANMSFKKKFSFQDGAGHRSPRREGKSFLSVLSTNRQIEILNQSQSTPKSGKKCGKPKLSHYQPEPKLAIRDEEEVEDVHFSTNEDVEEDKRKKIIYNNLVMHFRTLGYQSSSFLEKSESLLNNPNLSGAKAKIYSNTNKENIFPDGNKNSRIAKFVKSIDTPRQSKVYEQVKENRQNKLERAPTSTFNPGRRGVSSTIDVNTDVDLNNISEEIRRDIMQLESKQEESGFMTLRNLIECTELNSIEGLKSDDGGYYEPGVPSLLVLNRTLGSKSSLQSLKMESFISPKNRLFPERLTADVQKSEEEKIFNSLLKNANMPWGKDQPRRSEKIDPLSGKENRGSCISSVLHVSLPRHTKARHTESVELGSPVNDTRNKEFLRPAYTCPFSTIQEEPAGERTPKNESSNCAANLKRDDDKDDFEVKCSSNLSKIVEENCASDLESNISRKNKYIDKPLQMPTGSFKDRKKICKSSKNKENFTVGQRITSPQSRKGDSEGLPLPNFKKSTKTDNKNNSEVIPDECDQSDGAIIKPINKKKKNECSRPRTAEKIRNTKKIPGSFASPSRAISNKLSNMPFETLSTIERSSSHKERDKRSRNKCFSYIRRTESINEVHNPGSNIDSSNVEQITTEHSELINNKTKKNSLFCDDSFEVFKGNTLPISPSDVSQKAISYGSLMRESNEYFKGEVLQSYMNRNNALHQRVISDITERYKRNLEENKRIEEFLKRTNAEGNVPGIVEISKIIKNNDYTGIPNKNKRLSCDEFQDDQAKNLSVLNARRHSNVGCKTGSQTSELNSFVYKPSARMQKYFSFADNNSEMKTFEPVKPCEKNAIKEEPEPENNIVLENVPPRRSEQELASACSDYFSNESIVKPHSGKLLTSKINIHSKTFAETDVCNLNNCNNNDRFGNYGHQKSNSKELASGGTLKKMNVRSFEESSSNVKFRGPKQNSATGPGPNSNYVKYIERTASLARKNKLLEDLELKSPGGPEEKRKDFNANPSAGLRRLQERGKSTQLFDESETSVALNRQISSKSFRERKSKILTQKKEENSFRAWKDSKSSEKEPRSIKALA